MRFVENCIQYSLRVLLWAEGFFNDELQIKIPVLYTYFYTLLGVYFYKIASIGIYRRGNRKAGLKSLCVFMNHAIP